MLLSEPLRPCIIGKSIIRISRMELKLSYQSRRWTDQVSWANVIKRGGKMDTGASKGSRWRGLRGMNIENM